MPAKKTNNKPTKNKANNKPTKNKANNKPIIKSSGSKRFGFSKLPIIVFALLFGIIGSYFLYNSFAASNTTYNLNSPPVGIAPSGIGGDGYWIGASDGGVFAQGTAVFHGSMGASALSAAIVGIASTPDHGGYYLVGTDGAVYAYGDAQYAGGLNGGSSYGVISHPGNVVGIAAHAGGGYWIITSTGATYALGGAPSFGYNPTGYGGSIVDIAPSYNYQGYYAVSSIGQVYALGGGLSGCGNAPAGVSNIVRVVANGAGHGCWLLGSDGGVFAYGGAPFLGSMGNANLVGAAVGIASTGSGNGYWINAADGGVFAFGDATFQGRVVYNPASVTHFGANTTDITAGQSVTLSWASINTSQTSITNIGTVPNNSSRVVSPSVTTTYIISAVGPGGAAVPVAPITINVKQPPAPTGGGGAGGGGGSSSAASASQPELSECATGPSVVLLQQKLGIQSVDGNFGPATLGSVQNFQNAHGLASNGIVGAATWSALLGHPVTTNGSVGGCGTGAGAPTPTWCNTGLNGLYNMCGGPVANPVVAAGSGSNSATRCDGVTNCGASSTSNSSAQITVKDPRSVKNPKPGTTYVNPDGSTQCFTNPGSYVLICP